MNLKDLPAIYATEPYPGVSSSYVFIPTLPVVQRLEELGWLVSDARQTKSRSEERAPYARHMLRFRHQSLEPIKDPRGGADLWPEMVFINGHDGSATYRGFAGLFASLCLNGLIVGSVLGGFTVRHTGMRATIEAVEGGAMKLVSDELPRLWVKVDRMAERQLRLVEQHEFAHYALELRYKGLSPLLTESQVLERHREQDSRNDAWTVLNVIQENVLARTHQGRSFTGRRSNIRAVKAIREQTAINRGLWDYAEKLAA